MCSKLANLILVVSFLVVSVAGQEPSESKGLPTFPLAGKTFKINSNLDLISPKGRFVSIDEYYSSELAQARIHYEAREGRKVYQGDLYYDRKTDARVSMAPNDEFSCGSVAAKMFDRTLYGDEILAMMQRLLELVKEDTKTKHIVGPSKLLVLLAQQSTGMKEVKDNFAVRIRNHPAIQYKLELEEAGATVYAYYERTKGAQVNQLTDSIPLMLIISFRDNDHYLNINFFKTQLLHVDWITSEIEDGLRLHQSDVKKLDLFAFPTAKDCLSNVEELNRVRVFDNTPVDSVKFSFTAATSSNARNRRHFVAYDGLNALLRADSHLIRNLNKDSPLVHDRTRITDLRSNRRYIVDLGEYLISDNPASIDLKGQREPNRCVVTYEDNPSKSGRHVYFSMSEYLIGGEFFKYVGRARVRGLNANVYEGRVDQLPGWFANSMVYMDLRAEYQVMKRGLTVGKEGVVMKGRPMLAVIYVTDLDGLTKNPRLLQIEVYYLDHKTSPKYREALSASIGDFKWELDVSPYGESPDELFSFEEICEAEGDSYYEVDLLLTTKVESDSRRELEWFLDNPRPRNDALRVGILDTLDIQSVGLTDLESRVTNRGGEIGIAANFKLHVHHQSVATIQFIGFASIVDKSDQVTFIPANSLVDCLWFLGKAPKNKRIGFSEAVGMCYVEKDKTKHEFSKIFDMSSQSSSNIQLYLVDSCPDTSNKLTKSWLSDGKFQHLIDRALILQDTLDLQSLQSVGVKMRLSKVRVNQLNHQADEDLGGDRLPGLSLPESGDHVRQVDTVDHRSQESHNPLMSFEHCEAACLSELSCKSYSYCDDHESPRCILSTVSIVSGKTLRQVEEANPKRLVRGSRLIVTIDGTQFKLIRDFTCEIRNKDYLTLFHKSEPMRSNLKGKTVHSGVNSNQCAELCFSKSLAAVEAGALLHKQVEDMVGVDSQAGETKSAMASLLEQNKQIMSAFCRGFMYLDYALDEEQLREIRLKTNSPNSDTKSYCVLTIDNSSPNGHEVGTVAFNFDHYAFDFTSLFQRHSGFKLFGSPLEEDEYYAFQVASRQDPLTDKQYELLRESVARRRNFVQTKGANQDVCAQDCFLQTSGLWPACRSFDMIINDFLNEDSAAVCQLNTETLDSRVAVQRENKESTKIRLIHFEPRFKLLRDIMDTRSRLDELATTRTRNSNLLLGTITALVVVLFGLASGLFIGSRLLAPRLIRKLKVDDGGDSRPTISQASVDSNLSYLKFNESNEANTID